MVALISSLWHLLWNMTIHRLRFLFSPAYVAISLRKKKEHVILCMIQRFCNKVDFFYSDMDEIMNYITFACIWSFWNKSQVTGCLLNNPGKHVFVICNKYYLFSCDQTNDYISLLVRLCSLPSPRDNFQKNWITVTKLGV